MVPAETDEKSMAEHHAAAAIASIRGPAACYSTVPMWRQPGNDGGTALMLAAVGGHEAVAQLLLQHGADVSGSKHINGDTALMMWTALGGHEAVAQLLLQHGADVAAAMQRWCHSTDHWLLKMVMRPWPSCCYSMVPMWRQQATTMVPQP